MKVTHSIRGRAGSVISSGVSSADVGFFETGPPDTLHSGSSDSSGSFDMSSYTKAFSQTFGKTERIQLVPELMWLPTKEYSIDDQYHGFSTELMNLKKRHGIVVVPELANFKIYTLELPQAPCNDDRLHSTKVSYLTADGSPYISRLQLQQIIDDRQTELHRKMNIGEAVRSEVLQAVEDDDFPAQIQKKDML